MTLQVSGFAGAAVLLGFAHGWAQFLFVAAFGVHLAGDLLRLKKDGVI